MATRTSAYVDTSAFIALADRSDTFHPLFRQLFSNPPGLITTPLVVSEGQAWFLRRYDRYKALQFIAAIEEMKWLEIIQVGLAEQTGATQIMRRFSDQDLTLPDAMGLHVMQIRKIKRCWSTDYHLGLTGAVLVINEQ
jgi:predicted nucleic acid-binding protein